MKTERLTLSRRPFPEPAISGLRRVRELLLFAGLGLVGLVLALPAQTLADIFPGQAADNAYPGALGPVKGQPGSGLSPLRDQFRVQGLVDPGEMVFADGFESPPETQIQVWVSDTSGISLTGVQVRADGINGEVFTDAEGRAVVTAPAIDGALLRLNRAGYVPQWRRLDLSTGADDSTPLRIGLVPRAAAQTFNAGDPVTLNGADGAQVMLPANAFVDEDGQPVSGEIEAFITALDVSNPDGLAAFPGGFAAIGEGDEPGSLLTYGVVDFSFEQNGLRLQLSGDETALIDIPIYLPGAIDGTPLEPGDIIPLWSLDEDDGIWRFQGNAVVVASAASPTGLALQGEARHFSWWNADVFVSATQVNPNFAILTAFLRPTLHCNVLGEACPAAQTSGAWLNIAILVEGLPRLRANRWVPATGEPLLVEIPVGLALALDASVADGFFAIAEVSPSPLIAAQADEIIDVDIVLKPRHLVDDGWFVPGERLRGWMVAIDETHRYRFAGRAGMVFRLRGYPAASSTAGPGISADLGGRVQVRRGSEVLAEAIFDESTVAEINLPLPADDEYQVHFIAEGKVPGFYVATTAMNFPAAGVGGEVLFVARDLVNGESGVFTVDPTGSYVELSQPNLQGCVGPRMGRPDSGNCTPSNNSPGTGERFPSAWLPAFARQLEPGRIAYLSETDRLGFSELFTVETATPGLAIKLNGPEVGGPEGLRVVDYRNAPARPGRIVYKVVGSEEPTPNTSVTGPGNPGLLYAVEVAQPEQRRLLPRPSTDHWVVGWEIDAAGRRVVYESFNFDGGTVADHLYAVELDSAGSSARQVSHHDVDAGDRLQQRFAISPDGRWLAYSVRLAGDTISYEGFLVDLDDPDGTAMRISDPLHRRVRELRFAPDSRSLVYRQASFSSQLDGAGDLYWVDLSDPGQPAAPVRLGGNFRILPRPEQWRIAPTSDRVVAWSGRDIRENPFDLPGTDVLRLQLPFGANLGGHVLYAPDGETLLVRFIPGTGLPWGLLRHPPGAASDDFEVLIEPLDLVTRGVMQFALSAGGEKVYAGVDIDNGSRHAILQVNLDGEPVVTTLVPPEDESRVLLLLNPSFSPWLTFDVLSQ